MMRLKLVHWNFLVIRTGKNGRVGDLHREDVISPYLPRIFHYSRGMVCCRSVHGKEYSQFLVIQVKFIPHDSLNMVYQVGDTINGHSFGRRRYQNKVCSSKAIEGKHSFTWRGVDKDKIVNGAQWHNEIGKF